MKRLTQLKTLLFVFFLLSDIIVFAQNDWGNFKGQISRNYHTMLLVNLLSI